eukprot:4024300-Prymnesium_polylepis.2
MQGIHARVHEGAHLAAGERSSHVDRRCRAQVKGERAAHASRREFNLDCGRRAVLGRHQPALRRDRRA